MAFSISLPTNKPLLTVTCPKPYIWALELHIGQDNLLTAEFIDKGINPALDAIERDWREQWLAAQKTKDNECDGRGALIIIGRKEQDKFFSNGLDFKTATASKDFLARTFNPLLERILLFPIPTIAAINGHCFSAGLMLSLACDYRIMTDGSKNKAWMSIGETDFNAVWSLTLPALLRAKIRDQRLQRKISLQGHQFTPNDALVEDFIADLSKESTTSLDVLAKSQAEGRRFTPQEALADGFVDYLVNGNTADVLAKAEEIANKFSRDARAGMWGWIKADIYRDAIETMKRDLYPEISATPRSRL